jgi:hypothetical protein
MIARLSALDATFAPRGPQEGIMGKTLRITINPKANRTTSMSSIARPAPGLWKPLFNAKGEGTVSAPDGRARCHESAAAQEA